MNGKRECKTHLSFAGISVVRDQKTAESKHFDPKARIEDLYREIRAKDRMISGFQQKILELTHQIEVLTEENSLLRSKVTQYYGQDLDKFAEKHKKEIEGYVNDIKELRKLVIEGEKRWEASENADQLRKKITESEKIVEKNEQELKTMKNILIEREKIIERIQKELELCITADQTSIIEALKIEIIKISQESELKDSEILNTKEINTQQKNELNQLSQALSETREQYNSIYKDYNDLLTRNSSDSTFKALQIQLHGKDAYIKDLESAIKARDTEMEALSSTLKHQTLMIKDLETLNASYFSSLSSLNSLTSKCSQLENQLLIIKTVEREKVSYTKYAKLEQELIEAKEDCIKISKKYSILIEIIKNELRVILSSAKAGEKVERMDELLEKDDFYSAFQLLNDIVINLYDQNFKAQEQITRLFSLLQLSELKIKSLEEKSQLFSLTQQQDLESQLQLLEQQLLAEKTKVQDRDKRIEKLTRKVDTLQREIKASFIKIDLLKTQLAIGEKNSELIQQLQEFLKQETQKKNFLSEQLELYKKRLYSLENSLDSTPQSPKKQNSDPTAMLLQKIEHMKSELEHYCPSEISAQKELKSWKSAVNSLNSVFKKLEFVLKCIEDDFSCPLCGKLENVEVLSCRHYFCIACNKSCQECGEVLQSLNTNVFFKLSRRMRDLKRHIEEAKEIPLHI
jgi:hypothetical protein